MKTLLDKQFGPANGSKLHASSQKNEGLPRLTSAAFFVQSLVTDLQCRERGIFDSKWVELDAHCAGDAELRTVLEKIVQSIKEFQGDRLKLPAPTREKQLGQLTKDLIAHGLPLLPAQEQIALLGSQGPCDGEIIRWREAIHKLVEALSLCSRRNGVAHDEPPSWLRCHASSAKVSQLEDSNSDLCQIALAYVSAVEACLASQQPHRAGSPCGALGHLPPHCRETARGVQQALNVLISLQPCHTKRARAVLDLRHLLERLLAQVEAADSQSDERCGMYTIKRQLNDTVDRVVGMATNMCKSGHSRQEAPKSTKKQTMSHETAVASSPQLSSVRASRVRVSQEALIVQRVSSSSEASRLQQTGSPSNRPRSAPQLRSAGRAQEQISGPAYELSALPKQRTKNTDPKTRGSLGSATPPVKVQSATRVVPPGVSAALTPKQVGKVLPNTTQRDGQSPRQSKRILSFASGLGTPPRDRTVVSSPPLPGRGYRLAAWQSPCSSDSEVSLARKSASQVGKSTLPGGSKTATSPRSPASPAVSSRGAAIQARLMAATGALTEARALLQKCNVKPQNSVEQFGQNAFERSLASMVTNIEEHLGVACKKAEEIQGDLEPSPKKAASSSQGHREPRGSLQSVGSTDTSRKPSAKVAATPPMPKGYPLRQPAVCPVPRRRSMGGGQPGITPVMATSGSASAQKPIPFKQWAQQANQTGTKSNKSSPGNSALALSKDTHVGSPVFGRSSTPRQETPRSTPSSTPFLASRRQVLL